MTALTYRPELDGLRSIAVYLVLLFHAGVKTFDGGFVGVDLFFVLSGFLVTGVILREVDERDTFALGGFYARRVRRLLPAAVVVIVATAVFQVLVASLPARVDMVDDARASLLYFANWHFVLESRDYFAAAGDASPFLHYWSLSIEEQFYIVFPLLVLLVLRLSKRPMRLLVAVLGVTIAVSTALQVWRAGSDATYAYYATETRVYQLAAGALLAVLVREVTSNAAERRGARWSGPLALVGLLSLLAIASRVVDADPSLRGLVATAAAIALIAGLWWGPRGYLSRLLGMSWPRYLGQVSYGTYLWHWPVLLVLRDLFQIEPLAMALLGAVLSTALAALSFTLLESPVRRSRRLQRRRWSVAVVGVSTSALVAALVIPQVLEADRQPAIATTAPGAEVGSLAADLDRPVPPDLDLVAAKEDTGPETAQCTVEAPDECTRVKGAGAHVLLLGDSQARTYVPVLETLAREHDLTLSTNIAEGCPWQLGQINLREGATQDECKTVREDFVADVLPLLDVDVVIAVGLSRSDPYWESRLGGRDGPPDESLDELQVRTTEESAEAITAAGAHLVIVKSLFGTDGFGLDGFDPIECLATATSLSDCAVAPPLSRPVVDGVYDVLATSMGAVDTVDFNPVICPGAPVCAPVLGTTVVWKDPDHVTTEVLSQGRAEVWRELEATGAFA